MKKSIQITDIPKVNIFQVPENYFDTLAMSIEQRLAQSDEPNFSFGKQQNFAVPDTYFDTLSSRIMGRIANLEKQEIRLENLPKVNPFKVPEGYFKNAETAIAAHVKLQSIEKKTIFEIPADYFDELPARILSRTTKEARTIQVNWWQKGRVVWTAAASLVLMIGLGFAVPQFSESATEAAFNDLSREDINTYLATQDLSYLEYEVASATETALPKGIETRIIDDLEINKTDILEHLESQDIEDI